MTSHPSQTSPPGPTSLSPDSGHWASGEQQHMTYGSEASTDGKSPQYQNVGYMGGFSGMQKKVTRDGQPAKRRGPKPDSKPAQTRRQELNRQAQRTHRERKEQYIKALEIEVSRLREVFSQDAVQANNISNHQQMLLRECQQEIMILKDMLTSRGIPFETELETRKAKARMTGSDAGSLSPSQLAPRPFPSHIPGPPSSAGFSTIQEQTAFQQTGSVMSMASPVTHHSHSPISGPDIHEQSHMDSPQAVPDMPGIFEKDPQLGVDFILALESTCRDHGEYLVRRSIASPSDTDEALFSGHALMASCPPPSHISNTVAQKGGLEPTYPHQAPQVPVATLNTLLNLAERMKADGFVEGGQVTPIMALQSLRGHRNYHSLTRDDVVGMIDAIRNKVRCYGFGAVMEDFELRDALSTIFATKPEMYESMGSAEIDEMYS